VPVVAKKQWNALRFPLNGCRIRQDVSRFGRIIN
jgi:hypothetical protein